MDDDSLDAKMLKARQEQMEDTLDVIKANFDRALSFVAGDRPDIMKGLDTGPAGGYGIDIGRNALKQLPLFYPPDMYLTMNQMLAAARFKSRLESNEDLIWTLLEDYCGRDDSMEGEGG